MRAGGGRSPSPEEKCGGKGREDGRSGGIEEGGGVRPPLKEVVARYRAAPDAPVRATRSGKLKGHLEPIKGSSDLQGKCLLEEEALGPLCGSAPVRVNTYQHAVLLAEEAIGGSLHGEEEQPLPRALEEEKLGSVESSGASRTSAFEREILMAEEGVGDALNEEQIQGKTVRSKGMEVVDSMDVGDSVFSF